MVESVKEKDSKIQSSQQAVKMLMNPDKRDAAAEFLKKNVLFDHFELSGTTYPRDSSRVPLSCHQYVERMRNIFIGQGNPTGTDLVTNESGGQFVECCHHIPEGSMCGTVCQCNAASNSELPLLQASLGRMLSNLLPRY